MHSAPLSVLAEEATRIARDGLDARRVALVSGPNEDDLALMAEFEREFARAGRQVVSRATPPGENWLSDLLAARPDLLLIATDPPQAAAWIVDARQAGYTGPILGGPGLGSQLVVEIAGQAAEGTLYLSQYPPVPDDPQFVAAYEAVSGGALPGPVGSWAYAATREVLDRIEGTAAYPEEHRTCVVSRHAGLSWAGVPGEGGVYLYTIRAGRVFQQP